jgi:hypothetical protein
LRTAPWAVDTLCGGRGRDPPCSLSPALSVYVGLLAPYSRIGLLLPAAWLPNGSQLRRLRNATKPLVVQTHSSQHLLLRHGRRGSCCCSPAQEALQGRLTQLVEEDDGIGVIGIVIGIVSGIVIGIAIGIAYSGAEDAPAEMTAGGISRWR